MTFRFTSIRIWLLFVPTVLLCYAALFLTIALRFPDGLSPEDLRMHLYAFGVINLFWLLNFYIHNLFEKQTFRRAVLLFRNLISAMVVNTLIAIVYFYVQPNLIITPRRFLLVYVMVVTAMLLLWYFLIRYFVRNSFTTQVYIAHTNDELSGLANTIAEHGYLGFRFGGFIREPNEVSVTVLPNSLVIISDGVAQNPILAQSFYSLRLRGVTLLNHKRFYEELLRSIFLPTLNELWFLENVAYTEKRMYKFSKRIIDIFIAFLALIFFIATFPFIAASIKLTSPGPVLFKQKRVGQSGRIFTMYKYRTMKPGVANTWTNVHDDRITRLGTLLRKTRLDELPQCLNILKGDMSLVGPRPEQVNIVEALREQIPFYDERHLVKPGLTGWAQLHVYAASVEETKQKLEYDLYYIKHRSIGFDVEILLKTMYAVFSGAGR